MCLVDCIDISTKGAKAIVGLTASSLAKTKAGTPKDIRSNCVVHSYTFGKGKKQKAHLRIFSLKQEINFTLS